MSDITWYQGSRGTPTHQYLPDPVPTFTEPYPKSLWRITPGINDGKPYHDYLPGMKAINVWSLKRENVIRVYDISEPQEGFDHNGLAILTPSSCTSLHNKDVWEIKLKHPLDEQGRWKNLLVQNVLKVDGQLFRIDQQENGFNENGGYITVHASHITTDMADVLIASAEFQGGDAQSYIRFCKDNADGGRRASAGSPRDRSYVANY